FTEDELTTGSFENYSELDELGRCGVAFACVGVDIMPTEDREGIGQIKPSGWVTAKYDIVDGKYLYNRCHLIGFQLTGENANEKNLITGTRYFNVEGMLPFENMVADYVRETKNHVLYRVTPVFVGEDLVAKGVQMEAYSVEDDGEGVCFNVFVYNIQPGITINYANGQSALNGEELPENPSSADSSDKVDYILNTNSMKFHDPDCGSVKDMKDHNKQEYSGSRDALIADGYEPCGSCKP
ncbi:MAG: DNA/RNA non-specific endonuclease, partial [Clostridia bacterium]|nr:DNA/RNA non-specific endonuclease [Clostridia bacterium]